MKTQHTPGPWSYIIGVNGVTIDAPNQPIGKRDIARTVAMSGAIENARLIAAAPELLDAVLMLLGCTDLNTDSLDDTSIEAIEIARQAIAKAEGRNNETNP